MAVDPVTAGLNVLNSVIDRLFPDKAQAAAAKAQLSMLQQQGELDLLKAQVNVNSVEAANPNLFVAGWRPAVGWICAAALGYNDILAPMAGFVAQLLGSTVPIPSVPLADTMPVLLGLLGLGAMRTYEKINGVDGANH